MHVLESTVTVGICLTLCLAVLVRFPALYQEQRECAADQSTACAEMVRPTALCAISAGDRTAWPDCDPARLLQVVQQIRDLMGRGCRNGGGQ